MNTNQGDQISNGGEGGGGGGGSGGIQLNVSVTFTFILDFFSKRQFSLSYM